MSLAEAIIDIVADMEAETATGNDAIKVILGSYAKQLRTAVKAAGGSQPVSTPFNPALQSPEFQHRIEIEKAKEEFRVKKQRQAELEELVEPSMIECLGGNFDGEFIAIPGGQMPPVGTFAPVAGQMYQLGDDNKLHYHKEKSIEYRAASIQGKRSSTEEIDERSIGPSNQ